ncbi:MAG: hypothetical protein D3904_13465 [Candidatus Electrothrix sp. EH2]|nr:hypothetical protein [Candidatus Electrothrix sp. EH2]
MRNQVNSHFPLLYRTCITRNLPGKSATRAPGPCVLSKEPLPEASFAGICQEAYSTAALKRKTVKRDEKLCNP